MNASGQTGGERLGDVGERGILVEVFAALGEDAPDRGAGRRGVLVGPGDDTAYLAAPSGAVLATTDSMVRGHDWLDDWSGPGDVAVKATTQNLADLAAMGGAGTGLLVTLLADDGLELAWARGLAQGFAAAAGRTGVPVVGGDLSAAPPGLVAVTVTALGELPEGIDAPVLRSGAAAGDVLAVSGPLGRSGAGLELLRAGRREGPWVDYHLRPVPDLTQGPLAARAGATAMIDVSDGLVRDADRIARASEVMLELDEAALRQVAAPLTPDLAPDAALSAVLAGGEEHVLLATFPPGAVPPGWAVIGRAARSAHDGPAVHLDGRRLDPRTGGWDHFGG